MFEVGNLIKFIRDGDINILTNKNKDFIFGRSLIGFPEDEYPINQDSEYWVLITNIFREDA